MKPFEVAWTQAQFTPVREAIRRYRFPPQPEGAGWSCGCDPAFLRELCAAWERFDVEAAAAELNRFPQVLARFDGLDIHAVHVVGEAQGRRPLLLVHGWPGSTYEFWRVIEPLAFPSRHGGRAEDAFDLVIPSLPGYGFSGKPTKPVGARTAAALFQRLMAELGYPAYRAQGGDWGAGVIAWAALDYPESVQAIHLNYLLVGPDASPETEEEKRWKAAFEATQKELGAYAQLQGTKPQSLAYAMVDNPVAQAAWLVERFHDWADLRHRSFTEVFSIPQFLTDVMIYVMNEAFVTATWFYAGASVEQVRTMPAGRRVTVPTAFTAYPDPRSPSPPRSWLERGYNLTRWRNQPRGGHFAAMEVPDLFVEDLQDWGRGEDRG